MDVLIILLLKYGRYIFRWGFANVGRSDVRMVGLSVDHMVSADYVENRLSQSFHISRVD